MFRFSITLLLIFSFYSSLCQEAIVSEEINIHTYSAYHIIGQIDDNILLLLERNFDHRVETYNLDMVNKSSRQLQLDEEKVEILDVFNLADTAFSVLYTYNHKADEIIKINQYNSLVEVIDTTTISVKPNKFSYREPEILVSEDKSKVGIIKFLRNNELRVLVYDHVLDSTIYDDIVFFQNTNFEESYLQSVLTNQGDYWILLESNNYKNKLDDHKLEMYKVGIRSHKTSHFIVPMQQVITNDLLMDYDNLNGRLIICGLYDEESYDESRGYFLINEQENKIIQSEVNFIPFSKELLSNLYGKGKNKKDKERVKNFLITDIIKRVDGGMLIFAEMTYEYYRGTTYPQLVAHNDRIVRKSWTSHLHEDIIVTSLSPDSQEEWSKVIYKRQSSQDDNGIYSSYFTYKTPSQVRILFNDEIKSNNTVSEFLVDPKGNIRRRSLLSTAYQNLKLRIRNSKQISSSEILIPSQKNSLLRLVKINFDESYNY